MENEDLILFDEGSKPDELYNFYNDELPKKITIEKEEPNDNDTDSNNISRVARSKQEDATSFKLDERETEQELEPKEEGEDSEVKAHEERFNKLKEVGTLYLPDDYETPVTDDEWEKAISDSNKFRQQDAARSLWESLPEEGRPLLEYLLNGGKDINKYKEVFTPELDIERIDISQDENKRKVLETYYIKKGFSPEKARKQVEIVDNLLELDSESLDAYNELKESFKKDRDEFIKKAAVEKQEEERKEEAKWKVLQDTLQNTEDFGGGYVIGKKSKPKAIESLYKQVKLDDGSVTTDFNYRLKHVVLKDPKLTLVLADLLNKLKQDDKSKELYFDLSNIRSAAETNVTRSLKDKLESLSTTGNKFKNGSNGPDKDKTKSNFWEKVL